MDLSLPSGIWLLAGRYQVIGEDATTTKIQCLGCGERSRVTTMLLLDARTCLRLVMHYESHNPPGKQLSLR